jgi:serine/threonine protein kinase
MAYLESLHVIHRDACLENILVNEADLTVQITGFGGARDIYELESYVASMSKPVADSSFTPAHSKVELLEMSVDGPVFESFAYHLRILSPEALDDGRFSRASDCYAFGILMLELYKDGQLVFGHASPGSVAQMIRQGQLPTLASQRLLLRRLVAQCLSLVSEVRPRFSTIYAQLQSLSGDGDDVLQSLNGDNLSIVLQMIVEKPNGWSQATALSTDPRVAKYPLQAHFMAHPASLAAWTSNIQIAAQLSHDHLLSVLSLSPAVINQSTAVTRVVAVCPRSEVLAEARHSLGGAILTRMVCLEVLLALEYLHARGLQVRSLQLSHCRVYNNALRLFHLEFEVDKSYDSHQMLAHYARFLVEAEEALPKLDSGVLAKVKTEVRAAELGQRPAEGVGQNSNMLSLLAVRVQDLCCKDLQWEISWSDLTFVKILGSGQFGEVLMMTLAGTFRSPNATQLNVYKQRKSIRKRQTAVAVKRLLDATCREEFEAELAIMTKMRHPNLVTLLHVVNDADQQGLVLEYLDGGSLDEWLVSATGQGAKEPLLMRVLHGVACGMQELNRLGIVHRYGLL